MPIAGGTWHGTCYANRCKSLICKQLRGGGGAPARNSLVFKHLRRFLLYHKSSGSSTSIFSKSARGWHATCSHGKKNLHFPKKILVVLPRSLIYFSQVRERRKLKTKNGN